MRINKYIEGSQPTRLTATEVITKEVNNMGYWCWFCHQWVPCGATHYCYCGPTYPCCNTTHRAYKCPCGGEFDNPRKEVIEYLKEPTKTIYFCPFCNKELKI